LLTVVKETRDFVVLQLMSMSDQHIIAPSSFSWWGAFLAGTSNTSSRAHASSADPPPPKDARLGVVVAPRPWFGPKLAKTHSSEQLMLAGWKVVDWDTPPPTLAELEGKNRAPIGVVNASTLVDKVYVINLAHRRDRREHMRLELGRHGLLDITEFVPAVEVKDVSFYRTKQQQPSEDVEGGYPQAAPMPNWQNLSDPFKYYSRKLRPAEVATSLSHRLVWARIKAREETSARPLLPSLVLEDDALLRDDFNSEMPLLLKRESNNFAPLPVADTLTRLPVADTPHYLRR
jgi:hypothetical protein